MMSWAEDATAAFKSTRTVFPAAQAVPEIIPPARAIAKSLFKSFTELQWTFFNIK
jgi:hypothetical protein